MDMTDHSKDNGETSDHKVCFMQSESKCTCIKYIDYSVIVEKCGFIIGLHSIKPCFIVIFLSHTIFVTDTNKLNCNGYW